MAKKREKNLIGMSLILVEVLLLLALFVMLPGEANAEVGNPNATVRTLLEIGNVYPEVLNVSIDDDAASITLTPNATKLVRCIGIIRDYNGEGDINGSNATLYYTPSSNLSAADDNNLHYNNGACTLNNSFISYNGYNDDAYHVLANCTFQVEYYANPGNWRCMLFTNDTLSSVANWSDDITIDQLLSVGLPDTINYGTVNATDISLENETNVTNFGNVDINLSLEGYAWTQGDGLAMNCSLGNVQNITIEHEKYNLTSSNPGIINLAQTFTNYTNLSSSPVVNTFNLTARQNDLVNDALKPSYWRIYVPVGVSGNCTGNIRFGATTANGV